MNIYVGNLSYDVDDRELQRMFEEHGTVASAKVIIDRFTSQSKGFGFVEMPDDGEGADAVPLIDCREKGHLDFVVRGRPFCGCPARMEQYVCGER